MIYIRALLGQTWHFLGYDEHSEPFLLPHLKLAWKFDDRRQAEIALYEAKKVARLNIYPMEIYSDPETASNGD